MGNKKIRDSADPDSSTDGDLQKLWNWYVAVDGSAKTEAAAYLEKVEKDYSDELLLDFRGKMRSAIKLSDASGQVAIDAKNFEAIFGETQPNPTGTDIRTAALNAWTTLRNADKATRAKAKELAEARLYSSWQKRFKAVESQFAGSSGFFRVVQCLAQTLQTSVAASDTYAGNSGWAVYSRVSDATKAKLKAAIAEQLS